jgi:hypothetical protein
MNLSPITKLIKEKSRGEKEFKASNKITLFTASTTISSILNSKILRASRLSKSLIFFKNKRRCLRNRRTRVLHSIIWLKNSPSYFDSLSNLATKKNNSQSRLKRIYYLQNSDKGEITQRTLALMQQEQRRITIAPLEKKKSTRR